MKHQSIITQIMTAHRFDKKENPSWPDHPAAQAGKVSIEVGELMQAANDFKYHRGKEKDEQADQIRKMRKEAIEVAVKAIRFLESWEDK